MADATVTFVQIQTPRFVTGGEQVGQDEFIAEFKVQVDTAGCYAIMPKLRAYTRLPNPPFLDTDADVAYVRGAQLDCYCFKAKETKTFYVTGHGEPPKDSKALAPQGSPAIRLKDLAGHWPKSDFPLNNLEL
jgi:hypothetical protein